MLFPALWFWFTTQNAQLVGKSTRCATSTFSSMIENCEIRNRIKQNLKIFFITPRASCELPCPSTDLMMPFFNFWDVATKLARKHQSTSGCCHLWQNKNGWRHMQFWWRTRVLDRAVIIQNPGDLDWKKILVTWGYWAWQSENLPWAFCGVTTTKNIQSTASNQFLDNFQAKFINLFFYCSGIEFVAFFLSPNSFCSFFLLLSLLLFFFLAASVFYTPEKLLFFVFVLIYQPTKYIKVRKLASPLFQTFFVYYTRVVQAFLCVLSTPKVFPSSVLVKYSSDLAPQSLTAAKTQGTKSEKTL